MCDVINIPLLIANFFTIIIFSILFPGIQGICIEELKVPARVETGDTVTLSCIYDLQGKSLYSLNWWRGSEQFYQFTPNSQEQITVYDTEGIHVDKTLSTKNVLVLRNVSRASAGIYKCEVLADFPSFEKDSEITHMEVIDVPDHPPKVVLGRVQWSPGEVLMANCSYPGARPQPHLQWYINTDQIPAEHSRLITPKNIDHIPAVLTAEGNGGVFRISELTLVLKATHFSPTGRASLTCVATLPELYRKTTEVSFTMPGFRAAAPSQKFYGSGGYPPQGGSLMVVAALLVSLIGVTTL